MSTEITMTGSTPFENLSHEILQLTFSYLDKQTLANIAKVCRKWQEATNPVWKEFYKRDWPTEFPPLIPKDPDWFPPKVLKSPNWYTLYKSRYYRQLVDKSGI